MIQQLFEGVSVVVLSAFNLYYGFCLSITYDQSRFEQITFMSVGSIFGILACILLGAQLQALWSKRIARKRKKTAASESKPSFLMRVWQKYGLWGLAFCTGFIGTIPIVVISLLSGTDRYSIFWFLGSAKVIWAVFYAFIGQVAIDGLLNILF